MKQQILSFLGGAFLVVVFGFALGLVRLSFDPELSLLAACFVFAVGAGVATFLVSVAIAIVAEELRTWLLRPVISSIEYISNEVDDLTEMQLEMDERLESIQADLNALKTRSLRPSVWRRLLRRHR